MTADSSEAERYFQLAASRDTLCLSSVWDAATPEAQAWSRAMWRGNEEVSKGRHRLLLTAEIQHYIMLEL